MLDLLIIGGGPAGVAAGVYASRKKLHTALIAEEWGGQSVVSEDVQNWIGAPHISGADLAKALEAHLREYANDTVLIKDRLRVTKLQKNGASFVATLSDNSTVESRAVIIASGSKRRKLEVPGAAEFEMKGVTYCASCDGPLFADQDVVVVGGGNAAFESAAQLLAYTKSVTLLHRSGEFKADPITVEKVLANPKVKALKHSPPTAIIGDTFVTGVRYKDENGVEQTIPSAGVFVEIGMIPNTEFLDGLLELDEYKRITIDPWTQKTSVECVWAAGDCTNVRYHQNNISAGDAVRALEDAYLHLKTK